MNAVCFATCSFKLESVSLPNRTIVPLSRCQSMWKRQWGVFSPVLNVTAAPLFRLRLPHWRQAAGGWQDLCQRCVDIVLVAADVSLELVIIKLKMKQSPVMWMTMVIIKKGYVIVTQRELKLENVCSLGLVKNLSNNLSLLSCWWVSIKLQASFIYII